MLWHKRCEGAQHTGFLHPAKIFVRGMIFDNDKLSRGYHLSLWSIPYFDFDGCTQQPLCLLDSRLVFHMNYGYLNFHLPGRPWAIANNRSIQHYLYRAQGTNRYRCAEKSVQVVAVCSKFMHSIYLIFPSDSFVVRIDSGSERGRSLVIHIVTDGTFGMTNQVKTPSTSYLYTTRFSIENIHVLLIFKSCRTKSYVVHIWKLRNVCQWEFVDDNDGDDDDGVADLFVRDGK